MSSVKKYRFKLMSYSLFSYNIIFCFIIMTVFHASSIADKLAEEAEPSARILGVELLDSFHVAAGYYGFDHLRALSNTFRNTIHEPLMVLEKTDEPQITPPTKLVPSKIYRRVLLVGASSMQFGVGTELEKFLKQSPHIQVKRFGKHSTGLVRRKYFNWFSKIFQLCSSFKPDLVVAQFGGNDVQSFVDRERIHFGSPKWREEYYNRVREITRIVGYFGAKMVFMGMPIMRDPKFRKNISMVNDITRQAAEKDGAFYLSIWEHSSTQHGEYQSIVSHNGRRGLFRNRDGVHFSKLGARYIARHLAQDLNALYNLGIQGSEM